MHFFIATHTGEYMVKQDRRRDRRYAIDSDKIQVSVLLSQKIHSIKDISAGGLAVEYSPVTDELFESETIDIIELDCDRSCLPKIECKTVYDIPTVMQGRSFSGGLMRIRGLKFIELTKDQENELEILLRRCFDHSANNNSSQWG
jgi:hypothetical protein